MPKDTTTVEKAIEGFNEHVAQHPPKDVFLIAFEPDGTPVMWSNAHSSKVEEMLDRAYKRILELEKDDAPEDPNPEPVKE